MAKDARINVRITERLKERLTTALAEDGYTEAEFVTNAVHNYLTYREAKLNRKPFLPLDPLDTYPAVDREAVSIPKKGANKDA